MREALGSSPDQAEFFFRPVTFGDPVSVCAPAAGSKRTVSLVPAWFPADSVTNLIKRRENVTCRPCGSTAQLEEGSHGKRKAMWGSTSGWQRFCRPCNICWQGIFYKVSHSKFLFKLSKHRVKGNALNWI